MNSEESSGFDLFGESLGIELWRDTKTGKRRIRRPRVGSEGRERIGRTVQNATQTLLFSRPEPLAESPTSVSRQLGEIIGHNFTNDFLIDFIDGHGNQRQVNALRRRQLDPKLKESLRKTIVSLESVFTAEVYRVAVIVQNEISSRYPEAGVNLENVIKTALARINEARDSLHDDARADLGYPKRLGRN